MAQIESQLSLKLNASHCTVLGVDSIMKLSVLSDGVDGSVIEYVSVCPSAIALVFAKVRQS